MYPRLDKSFCIQCCDNTRQGIFINPVICYLEKKFYYEWSYLCEIKGVEEIIKSNIYHFKY